LELVENPEKFFWFYDDNVDKISLKIPQSFREKPFKFSKPKDSTGNQLNGSFSSDFF
jgi:hypothetical protein